VAQGDGLLDEQEPVRARERLGLGDVEGRRAAHGGVVASAFAIRSKESVGCSADDAREQRRALEIGVEDRFDRDPRGPQRKRMQEAGDAGTDDERASHS